ncbi:MAG: site-specific DNA-methyltransferase [Clostridiales bacterium]|nr:site-specific DNA-methyltransferase [Clostridiales bacterium]
MDIEKVDINTINPAPYNPRKDLKPGDPEYEKLKKSILNFGLVDPLVMNKRGNVLIGGHQRLKILKQLGYKTVDVSVVDLDQNKEKALNIALNKIQGDWDEEKLNELISELDDATLELTGFGAKEIEELANEFITPEDIDEDEVPVMPENPITQAGDIWILGGHKLICADATDAETYKGIENIDLCITDPPYNVDYVGKTKDQLKIDNDKMAGTEYEEFLCTAFKNIYNVLRPGRPIYIFHASMEMVHAGQAFTAAGFKMAQILIWVKNNITLGRQDYKWKHEPIIYGWKEGASHIWYGGFDKPTVIEDDPDFSKMSKSEIIHYIREMENTGNTTVIYEDKPMRSTEHPTMKPVKLIGRLICNSSMKGNVILDTFAGSGSTMIAAEQLHRKTINIEMDPRYCDVIVKRFKQLKNDDSQIYLIRGEKKLSGKEVFNNATT